MSASISAINKTVEKTNHWLEELAEEGAYESKELAYSALRAVLHAFRNRLLCNQAVHFASELPMLIQGIYFEGWDPAKSATEEKNVEAFLLDIATALGNNTDKIDPAEAVDAVFHLLSRKISSGIIHKACAQLSEDLREYIYSACEEF